MNTATTLLLTPAIHELRVRHPVTRVEIMAARQDEVRRGLLAGSFDLGLVNYLAGDDLPPDLEVTLLLRGRPVVGLRPTAAGRAGGGPGQ